MRELDRAFHFGKAFYQDRLDHKMYMSGIWLWILEIPFLVMMRIELMMYGETDRWMRSDENERMVQNA